MITSLQGLRILGMKTSDVYAARSLPTMLFASRLGLNRDTQDDINNIRLSVLSLLYNAQG